jgi:hypothetical protein
MPNAHERILAAIEGVLGSGTELGRTFIRAADSEDPLDLLLAHASFQELAPELKREIVKRIAVVTQLERYRRRRAEREGSDA